MHRHTTRGLLALLFLAPATLAWSALGTGLTLQPQSRLWVEGTSTVRSYECAAKTFDVQVGTTGAAMPGAVLAGEKAVTTVELKVPARQLDCANGTMNEHMLKALKANDHPEITFRLASYELATAADGAQARLTGTLEMGGTQKTVTIVAEAKEASPGVLRVVGSHEVRMTEFGLRPPSLMLGTMKVNERVKVNFDLLLKA